MGPEGRGTADNGAPARPASPPTLLGLDLGSSSLKALLLGLDGRVLAERSAAYPTRAPAPGWAEQDPDDWWAAAGEATRAVLAAVRDGGDAPGADVVGIGLSGQMHTFVLLDADGETVRPAITWMDTRAAGLLPQVEARIDAAGLRDELANPVVLGLTLPPLAWLREHEPGALARARTLLLAKDALRFRLTGEPGSEPTDASATLLFDVARRRWSTATLEAFGVDPALMPALGEPGAAAGRLTPGAARHLGLRAGVPVAFGAGDQQAAAVGTGTVSPGQAQLMVGTGAQALVVEAAAPAGEIAGLHAFCHARGWLRQASVNNAGVALDWVRTLLGLSWDELYAALGDAAPAVAPLFLPYLTGERAPLMKGHARGGWLGLEPGHDREALAGAAVAGVAVGIADGLRALPGPADRRGPAALRVRAGGGGLRSPAFAQAVADASGATLELLDASGASAVGAA
ncbi:MAG: xylulose kinase, partial [Trueperaceae bacterium]|nr:xylulose kinase [Trueperaceae bacterium]